MLVGIARLMEVSVRAGKTIQNLSIQDLEEFAVVSLQKQTKKKQS
jgi:hypothetical protein